MFTVRARAPAFQSMAIPNEVALLGPVFVAHQIDKLLRRAGFARAGTEQFGPPEQDLWGAQQIHGGISLQNERSLGNQANQRRAK